MTMTTTLTTRLRELMEEATQGEWITEQTGGNYGCPIIVNGGSIAAVWPESMLGVKLNAPANAALIVTLVNNAPTIIRLLEAVDDAAVALEFYEAHEAYQRDVAEDGTFDEPPIIGDAGERARSALATLRAAREGAR